MRGKGYNWREEYQRTLDLGEELIAELTAYIDSDLYGTPRYRAVKRKLLELDKVRTKILEGDPNPWGGWEVGKAAN
jgi:hypothetical protein